MSDIHLHIASKGDISAGLNDYHLVIDLGKIDLADRECREDVRTAAADLGRAITGEASCAHFSDECPNCLGLLKDGQCFRPGCVSVEEFF